MHSHIFLVDISINKWTQLFNRYSALTLVVSEIKVGPTGKTVPVISGKSLIFGQRIA